MNKKGDVWVSAVLYIALGMVIITIILSAGIPLIEKMRDKNTIIQTKNLLFDINANIDAVANEGVGSKRYLSPVVISSGALNVDQLNDLIIWKMTTKNLMMQPNNMNVTADCEKVNSIDCPGLEIFKEGALNMWMLKTVVEGEYDIYLELNYNGYIKLAYEGDVSAESLTGKYSFSIEHAGFPTGKPTIRIRVT